MNCDYCNANVSSVNRFTHYEQDGFGGRVSKIVSPESAKRICDECLERKQREDNFEIKT